MIFLISKDKNIFINWIFAKKYINNKNVYKLLTN